MIRRRLWIAGLLIASLLSGASWAYRHLADTGVGMTEAAAKYAATLDKEQQAISLLPYETPKRLQWHFIPKDFRKGLQIKEMNAEQRKAALALLNSSLSEAGYGKAEKIMALETILLELKKDPNVGAIRDTERYYVTLFGKPSKTGRWGFSFEGHHLSLNFVVENEKVISSTPSFFAANPALVKNKTPSGLPVGTRVLAQEELLGFELINALSEEQQKKAIIAEKAPREIRAAGEAQPPRTEPEGLPLEEMDEQQRQLIRTLVMTYLNNVPADVKAKNVEEILAAGPKNVHFAWAGALKPGVGHYYRIQGPTFLIEFVNTQPDAAGNPANHVHAVWRDMRGDFALTADK